MNFDVQITDAEGHACTQTCELAVTSVPSFDCLGNPTSIAAMTWVLDGTGVFAWGTGQVITVTGSMAGGTGSFYIKFDNSASPPDIPAYWLMSYTSHICNPTDNPVALTLTIPWTDNGNLYASTNLINFSLSIGGAVVDSDSGDLPSGLPALIVLVGVLPANSISEIIIAISMDAWAGPPAKLIEAYSDANFTLS